MGEETKLIKERINIAEVIGEYAHLKPSGRNLKALCPFHQEKTPSFTISPERGTWYCFGACNEGGDVFSFIQKIEGVDFPSALKLLAQRAGVELSSHDRSSSNLRQRLFDCIAAASRFYQDVLRKSEEGKKAHAYLAKRGVLENTLTTFSIGYAPHQWDALTPWLSNQGFSHHEMEQAGLIGTSKTGKRYDRFRGRIMFPIRDLHGRVVAFGGRIVPWHETGNEGKYVNSPETSLYEKRRTVYNLDQAKHELRKHNPCIVVEGYMDAVMLWQEGVHNVVASLGTAFTQEQIQLIARFTDVLHVAFDADAAGFHATCAATEQALAAGMTVATVVLPAGKDPADLALEHAFSVSSLFTHTQSLQFLLIEQLARDSSSASSQEKLDLLLPFVTKVSNPIQQGRMIQEIAELLHVPEAHIVNSLRRVSPDEVRTSLENKELESSIFFSQTSKAERYILGLCIHMQSVREAHFSHLQDNYFIDPLSLMVYNSLKGLSQQSNLFFTMSPEALLSALPDEHVPLMEGFRAFAEELLSKAQAPQKDANQEALILIQFLKRRSVKDKLLRMQEELAQSTGVQRNSVLSQFKNLAAELASIDKH